MQPANGAVQLEWPVRRAEGGGGGVIPAKRIPGSAITAATAASPPPPPGPVTRLLDVGSGSFGVSGGTVGGTAGYNWRTGPWILGVEGDYSWANITGSSATCGFAPLMDAAPRSDLSER